MKSFYWILSLVCLLVLSSCSDKSSFGMLQRKYSKGRIAAVDKGYDYRRGKKSRSQTKGYVKVRSKKSNHTKSINGAVGVSSASSIRARAIASKRSGVVAHAKKYIGTPYLYGGKAPKKGFDCSGFTAYVLKAQQLEVSGASQHQARLGLHKELKEVQKGDLLFFGKKGKVSNVGLVAAVKEGVVYMIHSSSSRGVVIDNMSESDYWMSRYLYARDVISNEGAIARGM